MAFSFMGCNNQNNTSDSGSNLQVTEGTPNYQADIDTLKVRFGAWCSPPPVGSYAGQTESFITEERYQELADMGLNFINGLYERNGSEDVMKALDCAKKAGVQYLAYYPGFMNIGSNMSADNVYEAYKNVLEHEGCMGLFVCDEPGLTGIKKIAQASKVYAEMQEKYGLEDKYLYTNLFPSYASAEQLNTSDYREYLNTYAATVKSKMMSVDFYPFGFNGFSYTISSTFLAQLEMTQLYAKAYGKEHWQFLQACSIGNYNPRYSDYAMQIYASMAYGVQVLQYFCYWAPDAGIVEDHLIASDGSRTQGWYDAQKINGEIHNFDHVFMNYVNGWQGVMPVIGTNNTKGKNSAFTVLTKAMDSHERIKEITTSEDSIVGCFKDKDGYDGFLAVNYSVPAEKKTDTVKIKFNKASKAIVYLYGQESIVDLTNGELNITLDAGQGAFIIPIV